MKLNLCVGLDIDALRDANPRFKFRRYGGTLHINPKCECRVCGEPMADGSYCGFYCTNTKCADAIPSRRALARKPKPKTPKPDKDAEFLRLLARGMPALCICGCKPDHLLRIARRLEKV